MLYVNVLNTMCSNFILLLWKLLAECGVGCPIMKNNPQGEKDCKIKNFNLFVKQNFDIFHPVKARPRDKAWVMVSEQGIITCHRIRSCIK